MRFGYVLDKMVYGDIWTVTTTTNPPASKFGINIYVINSYKSTAAFQGGLHFTLYRKDSTGSLSVVYDWAEWGVEVTGINIYTSVDNWGEFLFDFRISNTLDLNMEEYWHDMTWSINHNQYYGTCSNDEYFGYPTHTYHINNNPMLYKQSLGTSSSVTVEIVI